MSPEERDHRKAASGIPGEKGEVDVREVDEASYPQAQGFLQSRFWARFKERFGWQAHFFRAAAAPLLVLTRSPAPGVSLGYVPHGPEDAALGAANGAVASLAASIGGVMKEAGGGGNWFLRFDLPQDRGAARGLGGGGAESGVGRGAEDGLGRGGPGVDLDGLVAAPVDVQPPSTVLVDISRSEDEILAAMKSKTRYNVRLAAKRGVSVRRAENAELDLWYELYQETAERDRIAIHSLDYYRALFEVAAADEHAELSLLFAEHEEDLLGGIIVLRYGETATYLYGASSNAKRNLMAAYALQWEAMRGAKAGGASRYDLFGVPPADDPSHPMHGLYRFKTGFGGDTVHRLGAWDYPVSRLGYPVYRRAEILRNLYYKRFKKRSAR